MLREAQHTRRERTISAASGAPPSITVGVRNVVAVARIADRLPVDDLAPKIPGAALDTRVMRMVVRISHPKAAVFAFSSGKVIFTGLRDANTLEPAVASLLETLRAAGADLADPAPSAEIVNLVASGFLGDRVSLVRLAHARNFERIEYDPEQFPGLVYRSEAGPAVLVFSTGALVATGARSLDRAQEAAVEAWHIIDTAGAWQRCW
ncbi:MAG: TATA-box-binding protein [Methanospirillum sp.]